MADNYGLPIQVPLNEEEIKQLGLVQLGWSQIEVALTILICHFAKLNMKHGMLLVGKMDMTSKCEMLRQQLKHLMPNQPKEDELLECIGAMNGLAKQRNNVTHGLFSRSPETGQVAPLVLKRVPALQPGNIYQNLAVDLLELNAAIASRATFLWGYITEFALANSPHG